MPLDVGLQLGLAISLAAVVALLRRSGFQWMYPPIVFAAMWAVTIALEPLIRFGDLRLSVEALLVFGVGVAVFVVAGVAVTEFAARWFGPASARDSEVSVAPVVRVVVVSGITVSAVVLPDFVRTLQQTAAELGIADLAVGARTALSGQFGDLVPRRFASIASLGITIAFIAAATLGRSVRDRVLLALAVAGPLALVALTFARTPVFVLIIGVSGILVVRGMLRRGAAVTVGVATLVGGLAIGASLGKGPDTAGVETKTEAVSRSLGMYAIGGPLGFASVMNRPDLVGERGLSYRFVTQALHSAGVDVRLPDNVLGYSDPELGNVYTMYFAYWLDFGWIGIVLIAAVSGALATALYEGAARGSTFSLAALGLVYPALITAGTGDGLFNSSVPWLLLLVAVGALHAVLQISTALRRPAPLHPSRVG